jgi:hypothetical protein
MKTCAGLWIDHREAVIVVLSARGQETTRIKSWVEKQLRRAGQPDTGSFPAQAVPCDISREREYRGDLARYYDEIISHLRRADEILIFGPGEAKGELKRRFGTDKSSRSIITLEPADKMTEPQIVAHVRQHFQPLAPRVGARLRSSPILNQV